MKIKDTEKVAHHDFGIRDPWGRAIGGRVITWKRENDEGLRTDFPFALNVQATRNGQKYGASNYDKFFATEAERDAHIAKYLKNAAKYAVKVAARGTLSERNRKA